MSNSPEVDVAVNSASTEGTLTQRVLEGLLWVTSGIGIQVVLRLAVVTILARLLTPEDFGLMSAAGVVLGLASYMAEFGIFSFIEQRPVVEERHLRTALTIYLFMGAVFGLVLYFTAGLVAGFFKMDELVPILQVVALTFPLMALISVPAALLKRQLRFRWLAGLNVISYLVGMGIVGIGMAWLGYGAWALIGGTLAALITSLVILLIVQPFPKRPMFDRPALNEILHYGSGFALGRLFIYVGEQGDNMVVGRWLGAEALGIYGRAYQMLTLPVSTFGTALKSVLIPSMAKLQHVPERLGGSYRQAMVLIALIFLPTSAIAVVLAPELVLTLFGSQWTAVIIPFQVLAAGIFFRANYMISDSMIQAMGQVYRRAWRSAAFGVLTIAGALIGQFWGLTGVAAGVLVALSLNSFLQAQLCLKLTSLPWLDFLRAHVPGLLLGSTTLVTVYLVTMGLHTLALHNFVVLIIALVVTGLVQLLLVYLLPKLFLGQDGQYMLQTVMTMVTRKLSMNNKKPAVSGENVP